MPTFTDPISELRERGLRVTPQRRAILEVVNEAHDAHLTADEIHARAVAQLPEVSRATVYNVLGEFERVGLLQVVSGLGAARYDRNVDHDHHHFRCLECGRLYDISPPAAAKLSAGIPGFKVQRTHVILEGTCPECNGGVSVDGA